MRNEICFILYLIGHDKKVQILNTILSFVKKCIVCKVLDSEISNKRIYAIIMQLREIIQYFCFDVLESEGCSGQYGTRKTSRGEEISTGTWEN